MSNKEAIEAALSGSRARTNHSLHEEEKDVGHHLHKWRDIACDGDTDVLECSECGKQRTCACTFDDDFA